MHIPAALVEGVHDSLVDEQPGNRLIASSEALANRLDIWNHALLLPGMECSGPAHARHDLI